MVELKQRVGLLFFLAVLLVAKFILVPVFSWQNETLMNIKSLEKKYYKITNVLSNEAGNAKNLEYVTTQLNKAEHVFFSNQPEANFKLVQQKKIEKLIEEHQIKVANIGWQTVTDIPELSATRYSLQLVFSGLAPDAVTFINTLEAQEQYIKLSEIILALSGQNDQKLGLLRGKLVLEFFVANKNINILAVNGGNS